MAVEERQSSGPAKNVVTTGPFQGPQTSHPLCGWCIDLAFRGMVAMTAGPMPTDTPEMSITSSKSVVRFLKTMSSSIGIDRARIVAAGGSGDGHMAASCGILNGYEDKSEDHSISSQPAAMVLLNPALDWTIPKKVQQMGLDRTRSISPGLQVKPGNPPAIVMHGTDDQVLDVGQAQRFAEEMSRAGNRCDLQIYEDAQHGF